MSHSKAASSNKNTNSTRTLIYPGAGWDSDFVKYFQNQGYTHFILYDALPQIAHYEPGQRGWNLTKTPEAFFHSLQRAFGPPTSHDVAGQTFTFPNNVTYRYSCDIEKLDRLPSGDILLSGFSLRHGKKRVGTRIGLCMSCFTAIDGVDNTDVLECHIHSGECGRQFAGSYRRAYNERHLIRNQM